MVLDQVVHYKGARRRYVVARIDQFGHLDMIALSGGPRGCNPTGAAADQVELDSDQGVEFSGASTSYLRGRYGEYTRRRGV